MIWKTIPGRGEYKAAHLALDLSRTIALDAETIEAIPGRLELLRELTGVVPLTTDTQGSAQGL